MEQRELKVIFNKSGGNASKAAMTTRITIPNAWVKQMSITPEQRDVMVTFDNNKITIEKKGDKNESIH